MVTTRLPAAEIESIDELPSSLTGRRRVIVTLWREDKSESEIASQLGIAPDSVAKRISEARSTYGDGVVPRRRSKRQHSDSLPEEQT